MHQAVREYREALDRLLGVVREITDAIRSRRMDTVVERAGELEAAAGAMESVRSALDGALARAGRAGLLSYRESLAPDDPLRRTVDEAIQGTVMLQHELKMLRKLVAVDRACYNRLARTLGLAPAGGERAGGLLDRQA